MPTLLAAPDKFRGTATAAEAAAAIARGARAAGWDAIELPLADGGEGTLDALGGANRATRVTGPLGDPVDAQWRLDRDAAVVEAARASGLSLVEANDPVAATSRGTGELIAAAIEAGARTIVVGVGGSATTDGGLGALEAVRMIPFAERGVAVTVGCDVQTTFVDAAATFAPQKGASTDEVAVLTARLETLAAEYVRRFGVDVRTLPGSGAAGGLAGGLAALGAELLPGFDVVAAAVGLDDALAHADLVVSGEGILDRTSLDGKVVGGLRRRCAASGVPFAAVVGENRLRDADFAAVSLVELYGKEAALRRTGESIAGAAQHLLG